jgi:hypothetical protein
MASLALPAWTHRRHPIVAGETRHWQRSRVWRATLTLLWVGTLLFLVVPMLCTLAIGSQTSFTTDPVEAILMLGGTFTLSLAGVSGLAGGLTGLVAGLLGATLIARERECQSWPFLRLTTLTSLEIVGGKFSALVRTLALPMHFVAGLRVLALLAALLTGVLALAASGLTLAELQAMWVGLLPTLTGPDLLFMEISGAFGLLLALAWWLLEPYFGVCYNGAVGLAASSLARSRGTAIVLTVAVHFCLGLGLYAPAQQVMSLGPVLLLQNPTNMMISLLPALTVGLPLIAQSVLQVAVLLASLAFTINRVEHLSE